MRKMVVRLVAFCVSTLPMVACEHGAWITGTIEIPVEVQQQFSAQNRGNILYEIDFGDAPTKKSDLGPAPSYMNPSLGILCDSQAVPMVIDFGPGIILGRCGGEAHVRVWIEPVQPGDIAATWPCGLEEKTRAYPPVVDPRKNAVAYGEDIILEGKPTKGRVASQTPRPHTMWCCNCNTPYDPQRCAPRYFVR